MIAGQILPGTRKGRGVGLTVVVAVLLLATYSVSAENNATYSVLAPSTLRAGSSYGVSVTLFEASQPVTFTLRLQEPGSKVVLSNASVTITPSVQEVTERVSLMIPEEVPMSSYLLVAEGSGGLTFSQNATVTVSSKTLSLFIQTDKAFYKPGQLIQLRAIVTRPDLKPYKGEMNITIYDHNGNKIIQWLKVQNNSGVVAKELQLSSQTPLGKWKIELRAMANVFKKEIDVMEYVLPKFEVKVQLPPYYFVNRYQKSLQKDLSITVTARYTYGEPVKGRANITIQIGKQYIGDIQKYPVKTMDLLLTDGKAEASVTIRELLALIPLGFTPDDLWTMLPGRDVVVSASVLETVTGITLDGNSTVRCWGQRYSLEFLDISPDNFKVGMTYNGYLQLSQVDKSAPLISDVKDEVSGQYRSVQVRVAYMINSGASQRDEYVNLTLTESGYMMFSVDIASSNVSSVSFTATYTDAVANDTVQAYKTITPFKSKDNEGIQVSLSNADGLIKAGQDVTFSVKSTVAITSYSYVILSKGTTVMVRTVSETSPTREHSFHIYFSTSIAQQLSPSATLVVWYISNNGEIICDSLKVAVDGIFANEVSLSFNKEKVAPADTIELVINAYAGSYVGVLAVDQSVLLIQSGNDITQQLVRDDQEQYSPTSSHNPFPMPMGGPIARRKRSVFIGGWWPIFLGGTDTYTLLQNAGLIILTDAYVHREQGIRWPPIGPPCMDCPMPPVMEGMPGPMGPPGAPGAPGAAGPNGGTAGGGKDQLVEPATTRTIFPETWLWGDIAVGPQNTTTLTATVPDTITSWVASAFAMSDEVGMGVASTTSKVTVFQPFFVSLKLPYSIIRGEEFALQVTVFNYLTEVLQVRVTLKASTEFLVRLPNAVTPVSRDAISNIRVNSNEAAAAYFWIVPQKLGYINIEVKAQSNVAADAVKRTLLVKPEGVQQSYSSAVFVQLPGNGSEYNSQFNVSLPPTGVLVPGSQYIECTVIGDLMGPSIQGLDSLLQMPWGCGEQNMLTLAPDVYIMDYLTVADLATSEISQKAMSYMLSGYQRELTYQRTDGSFSAFGNDDMSGSTWLSAFVCKVFHQAKDYIAVEDEKIAVTLKWIIQQQNTNGSFAEPGRVIHTDMQGGSSQGLAMSAYVLIALLENKANPYLSSDYNTSITSAVRYVEDQLSTVGNDSYTLSIIAYALSLAGSDRANEARDALMRLSISKDGMRYWQNAGEESKDSVVGEDGRNVMWEPPYHQTASSNVEVASYALLLFTGMRDITGGWPIAKWLISQRNANGGFVSTQDTVMGLEALASFAALTGGPTDGSGLEVVVSAGPAQSRYQPITRTTALLLQSFEIPANVSVVNVNAKGKGAALVQLNVKYNTYSVNNVNGIKLTLEPQYNGDEVTLKSCGSYDGKDSSGMAVMDIQQLTGYDVINADKLRDQCNGSIMRIENDDDRTVLYINELTKEPCCVDLISRKNQIVDKVQKAPASLYSYYKPAVSQTILYAAQQSDSEDYCTSCPACCACDGTTNSFKCTDGGCRPANVKCDGVRDCTDGSDEANCGQPCDETTFKCKDGMCVAGSARCDERIDCHDGSDEIDCKDVCSMAGAFKCDNGQCVAGSQRCDGKQNCFDGSDELVKTCGNDVNKGPLTGSSRENSVGRPTVTLTTLLLVLVLLKLAV